MLDALASAVAVVAQVLPAEHFKVLAHAMETVESTATTIEVRRVLRGLGASVAERVEHSQCYALLIGLVQPNRALSTRLSSWAKRAVDGWDCFSPAIVSEAQEEVTSMAAAFLAASRQKYQPASCRMITFVRGST